MPTYLTIMKSPINTRSFPDVFTGSRSPGRMIGLFVTMVLVLVTATPLQAQPESLPFTAYDYNDVILTGRSSTATYFFRVPSDIDLANSYITLQLGWSEVLMMNRSFVSVRVNDMPVTSRRLSSDPGTLRVPLAGTLLPEDNFVKLEIGTDVTITDDRCEDVLFNTMWVTISGRSTLHVRRTGAVAEPTIASFVPTIRYIGIPDNPSLVDMETAVWLKAFLDKTWGNQSAEITTYAEAIRQPSGSVLLGMNGVIPDSLVNRLTQSQPQGQGLLELIRRQYRDGQSIRRYRHLIVTGRDSTGYKNAVNALLDRNQVSTAFGSYLSVASAVAPYEVRSQYRNRTLTLRDLGAPDVALQGIGSQQVEYNFSLNDFGYLPENIDMVLNARYSSIDPEDRGILNVYINDFLQSSQRLDQSGYLSHQLRFRRDQLQPFNTITVEFVYYPPQMSCESVTADFSARVDTRQSVLNGGREYQPEPLSFHHFPTVFYHPETTLLIDRAPALRTLNAVARTVAFLNTNVQERMLLFPRIYYQNEVDRQFLRSRPVIGFGVGGSTLTSHFDGAMVRSGETFRIQSEGLGRELFATADTANVGIAQIFLENAQPVLLLTAMGGRSRAGHEYIASVISDQRFRLTNNLGIANHETHHLFNINEYTGVTGGDGTTTWQYWFDHFGFVLLLAVLLLLVFGYLAIRRSVLEARKQFQ